jgi:multicomponent Na+:H+ antiporter subunit E
MAYAMLTIGLISRAAILAFTWWVLTQGARDAWQVGVPAVFTAIYIDYRLSPPKGRRWSLGGLLMYVLSFFKFSISGGIDVAWRAYHPRLPLNPAMVNYPLSLTSPAARNLFICTVSLLPGTLSAELDEETLVVHVLDVGRPFAQELNIIEDRVASIFQHRAQTEAADMRND